jgi:type II secretory pathway pseudopilin PulG
MTSNRAGFTIVELLISIIVVTVALLAMLGSSAVNTRAITRGRNIDLAAIYAARRLELLRLTACSTHLDSSETLMRGSDTLSTNSWRFSATNDPATGVVDGYQILLTNTTKRDGGARRQYIYEAGISCAP